jgi:hypothetical protein
MLEEALTIGTDEDSQVTAIISHVVRLACELPYEAVRQADDPDAMILAFFQSTYEAAAILGHWDRDALEHTPLLQGVANV